MILTVPQGIHKVLQTEHTFLQVVASIFEPPIGPLLAAMLSTFGWYRIMSDLVHSVDS